MSIGNTALSNQRKRSTTPVFLRAFRAELLKLRHNRIWLAVVVLPIVAAFLGWGSYTSNGEAMSGEAWQNLWTQMALFYGYFIYPVLLACIASALWRVEHFEKNWNALLTSTVPPWAIWFAKLLVLFLCAILAQGLILLFYVLIGKIVLHLPGGPPSWAWWWLLGGSVSVMAPACLSLLLSERIRSFALPVGIAFASCLVGMFCYTKGIWIYPNTAAILGINAQHAGLPETRQIIEVFGTTLLYLALSSFLGIYWMKRRDVKTD